MLGTGSARVNGVLSSAEQRRMSVRDNGGMDTRADVRRALLADLPRLTEDVLDTIRTQIPAYRTLSPAQLRRSPRSRPGRPRGSCSCGWRAASWRRPTWPGSGASARPGRWTAGRCRWCCAPTGWPGRG